MCGNRIVINLQGVYVHDVVAAGQLVSFGISTFAALVGVDGVAQELKLAALGYLGYTLRRSDRMARLAFHSSSSRLPK